MNLEEQNYLDLMKKILETGSIKKDRTNVGTKNIFGTNLRFSLENNTLPLLTTKKMYVKGIIEELLFFIRGETNTKKLEEKNVNIWKGNTSREFLDKRGLFDYPEGEMGPLYGKAWRCWENNNKKVDQLQNAFDLIKNDPDSRRIMVTAYNPSDMDKVVLPPCHFFFEFYVDGNELSCQYHQRSVDYAVGAPYNIASYAILTHLMAKATNLKAKELIFVGGNTHLYSTHFEGAKEQITREPFDFPQLNIKKPISSIKDMENLSFEDFEIINYKSHSPIKLEMSV